MPCTKNHSSSKCLFQARLPQPFTTFLLIPLSMPLIPHPTSCEVVCFRSHWSSHLHSAKHASEASFFLFSKSERQDENQFCWILNQYEWYISLFFFFLPIFLSCCFGLKADRQGEMSGGSPNSRHRCGINHKLWKASVRGGRRIWEGPKAHEEVSGGVWMLAKGIRKLIFFFFSKPLPKWPAPGRDPITACLSRESLAVGSFQMGRPLWRQGRTGGSNRTSTAELYSDSHACYVCVTLNLSQLLLPHGWNGHRSVYLERLPTFIYMNCVKAPRMMLAYGRCAIRIVAIIKKLSSAAGKIKCAYVYSISEEKTK